MSDPSSADGTLLKARRKGLGWSRRELADRAGIDPRVVQLLELDQWHEGEASGRVRAVLMRAESGELDVRLPPLEIPDDATMHTMGGGPVAEA